uniref:Odorant binding protein 9 n=1 Tax=Cyrtorhinus lividipennis TaxID=1032904 RepID=A0A1W6AWH2_9HEMI|nr:odorant binding protein 9 [Cyrtorhinus lividipennis]
MSLKLQFVVFAAIGFVCVSAYREALKDVIKDCQGGKEVTEDELDEFTKPLVPKNEEERCLMACVMKTYNIINDGHFDHKLAFGIMKGILKDHPEKLERIKAVMEHCGEDVPKHMDNECDLAGEIMQCEVKYQQAMGGQA